MFSIWFFIWLLMSLGLIAFLGWTVWMITRQKRAWRLYAKKYKLRYKAGSFYDTPDMQGPIEDYTVHLFAGEHLTEDVRRTRKLTAIEIQLKSKFPVELGVSSGGMVDFIRNLNIREEYRPEHDGWDSAYIAVGESYNVIENYLTRERLDHLTKLMKTENSWVIFVARGDITLLRIDTPDPLDDPKKINKLVKVMLEVAKICELQDGESGRLKIEKAQKREKEKSLQVDESTIEDTGLSLEED